MGRTQKVQNDLEYMVKQAGSWFTNGLSTVGAPDTSKMDPTQKMLYERRNRKHSKGSAVPTKEKKSRGPKVLPSRTTEELRADQNEAIKNHPGNKPRGGGGGGNTSDTGRGETRTNAKGVVQQGTQTGVKAMTLADANGLLSPGYQIENPFSSNSLPGTNTSAYSGPGKSVPFQTGNLQINTGAERQTLSKDLYNDGGAVTFQDPTGYKPISTYIQAQQTQGSPNLTQSGAVSADKPTGRAGMRRTGEEKPAADPQNSGINWGARSMADNSDENVRRRHAMLDGSVHIGQAMRNQEAIQGRFYAGGKHYQVNPNAGKEGENDFMEISADSARQRSWGNMTAQQVADKHMKKVKETKPKKEKPTMVTDVVEEVPTGATPQPSAGVNFNTDVTFTQPGSDFPSFSTKPKKQY